MKRRCENWISDYLKYTIASEAPDKFHFWTAVSVIAGALRRRVWIDMGHFQWTPNFYIVFVAPPGIVSKTTTANIGMNLLREIPEIAFGPESVTWQSLVTSMAQAKQGFEYNGLIYPMSPITIVSGEFGTFLNPSDRDMVDILVSLWDGQVGSFVKRTKTQGEDVIENPWVNILACTTPAWIAGNFPDYLIGGGFTSRTIFVYAEQKRQFVAYPKYAQLPNTSELRENLVHDLEVIASDIVGEYELTPEARQWGEQWYERLYTERPAHLDNDRFAGYLARKQTHLHKLAIVLSASKHSDLAIHLPELQLADSILTGVEQDMPLVFAQIGRNPISVFSQEIYQFISRLGVVPEPLLFQQFHIRMELREFEEALASLTRMGKITKLITSQGTFYALTKDKAAPEKQENETEKA